MNKNSAAFLAFVAGAATGAALGVLFAPEKGKVTRDKLSYQLDTYKKKLLKTIKELKDGKEEVHNEARDEEVKNHEKKIQEVNDLMAQIDSFQESLNIK